MIGSMCCCLVVFGCVCCLCLVWLVNCSDVALGLTCSYGVFRVVLFIVGCACFASFYLRGLFVLRGVCLLAVACGSYCFLCVCLVCL